MAGGVARMGGVGRRGEKSGGGVAKALRGRNGGWSREGGDFWDLKVDA